MDAARRSPACRFLCCLLPDETSGVAVWWSTGLQQPTNRESVVQAYATVRMPSQNEAQMITQQIEASLPERAKVRG